MHHNEDERAEPSSVGPPGPAGRSLLNAAEVARLLNCSESACPAVGRCASTATANKTGRSTTVESRPARAVD